ncbi:tetratricopeptide repeat protein [Leptolyngbya sp. BC1307]|uniref:tetratricopeptide repeat protein n=1 Tax=Leptolyngbya sp. BC1307 TaxID=2029589 RepID=UPI000EFBFAAB|nr:tetratricopeptide repeat protein [Leptolyngbya sp. BC1307]
MEAQVAAALEVGDYQQVTRLLKQWQSSDPTNPTLRLYAALLQEQTNRLEAAEKSYLKLLKHSPSGKIMSQARAGLGRIQQRQKVQKAEALAQAKRVTGGDELAILAVAAPAPAERSQAIAGLAQIFNLDLYTAQLKLPPSGFRLYRIGPWGEVSYYAKTLKQAHTPALTAKVSDIKALQTFQICYFKAFTPQPTVVCKNAAGQLGTIGFDWAEVSQRVDGQLPIFEQVVDLGPWGKTVHKEKVQDYAQVVDFHLAGRQIVLRACDRLYQYQKGIALSEHNELNSRIQWNQLLAQIDSSTPAPHPNDFTRFGESALEFISLLPPIYSNLDIDRRAPSHWDQAFHLYSSLFYFNR